MEEITLQDLDYLAEDKLNELGEELFNKLQAEGCNIIDNGWIEELPEKAKKVEEQGEIYYWWGEALTQIIQERISEYSLRG